MSKSNFWHYLSKVKTNIYLLPLCLYLSATSPILQAIENLPPLIAANKLLIDDIVCEGNKNTNCSFITNKYYQKIGDELNPEKINEAKLRLSTLNQFRDISVHLKKGHRKGNVIVVFKVIESDHLQYELSSFYSQNQIGSSNASFSIRVKDENNPNNTLFLKGQEIQDNRINFETRIIDYNFLGTGKQLSLSVANQTAELFNITENIPRFDDSSYSNLYFNRAKINSTTLYLDYFDPHLFNSEKYFFLGQLGIFNTENKTDYSENNESGITTQHVNHLNSLYSFSLATIGIRFAEYSTFSVTTHKSEKDNKLGIGWAYGWNSQNDNLFPTEGSFFRLHYRINYDLDTSGLYIDFQKNHKISERIVFSYGLGESALNSTSLQQGSTRILYGTNKSDTKLFVKFSGLLSSNKVSGDYSGWNLGYQFADSNGGSLFANYVYHTDKIIFNFGFTYYPEKGIK